MAWSRIESASRIEPSPASASNASASSSASIFSRRGKVLELVEDFLKAHGAKAEMLAARSNGLRNILRLGRGQHEHDVAGRLLQRFQQSIESRIGDLVGLVENVDLEAIARRAVARSLAQLADLVNAAIGGGVNLNHVHGISRADFGARFAYSAGLRHRLVRRPAVQRHGQNARHGGLADPAMPAEDVSVRRPALLQGVLQGPGNMFLPDDLGEFLRTVLTG